MSTLKNLKFRIASPEQSERLQNVLFSLGYSWEAFPHDAVKCTDKKHLVVYTYGAIRHCGEEPDAEEYFEKHANTYQDTEAFIAAHSPAKPLSERSLEDAYDQGGESFFGATLNGGLEAPDTPSTAPWLDNMGECPVEDGDVLVDVEFRDGDIAEGEIASHLGWKFQGEDDGWEIVKWRYHNAEDWFKAPKTLTKSLDNGNYSRVTQNEQGHFESGGWAFNPVGGNGRHHTIEASALANAALMAEQPKRNKYMREIKPGVWCDVYDVLRAFEVTDGALAHMIKKCLAAGKRGHKSAAEDYADIVASAVRAQELHSEWEGV